MIIELTEHQLDLVKKEIEILKEHREHIEDGDHWEWIDTNDEIENLEEVVRTKHTHINCTGV